MLKAVKIIALVLAACLMAAIAAPGASIGTKVLKGAAVGLAVKAAAKPLNSFINTITLNHGMKSNLDTKVVPILSVGEKGYVGGAQVSGPKIHVDKVQAVFQYEKNLSNNNYRARILVPSSSINPLQLQRVPKVGVSALIDVALAGRIQGVTVGKGIGTGDIIRNAAVLVAVKNLGGEINKGINVITLNKGLATKVVPMGSIGEKAYIGGAQVSGSASVINPVNAVWQYEDNFDGGKFRVKVLVPTTSSNPLKMKRVQGAGITAVIDMAVKRQEDAYDRDRDRRGNSLEDIFNRERDRTRDRYREPDIRIFDRDNAEKDERKDNGKHKGWFKGEHKGWDKNRPDQYEKHGQ